MCHSRGNGNPAPYLIRGKAGNQKYMKLDSCFHRKPWIPAFVGMTDKKENGQVDFKSTYYFKPLALKARVVQLR